MRKKSKRTPVEENAMKPIQSIKVATFASYREAMQGVQLLLEANFVKNTVAVLADEIGHSDKESVGVQTPLSAVLVNWLIKGAVVGGTIGAVMGANEVMNPMGAAIENAVAGILVGGIGAAGVAGLLKVLLGSHAGEDAGEDAPSSAFYYISVDKDQAAKAKAVLKSRGILSVEA